jgi:hypothetical protein
MCASAGASEAAGSDRALLGLADGFSPRARAQVTATGPAGAGRRAREHERRREPGEKNSRNPSPLAGGLRESARVRVEPLLPVRALASRSTSHALSPAPRHSNSRSTRTGRRSASCRRWLSSYARRTPTRSSSFPRTRRPASPTIRRRIHDGRRAGRGPILRP